MKRILLAVFAAILIIAWAVLMLSGNNENWVQQVAGGCLRAGLILGAVSLAFPQVIEFFTRFPPWLVGCALLSLLIIIRWPKSALVIVPGLVAMWLLGPKTAASRNK